MQQVILAAWVWFRGYTQSTPMKLIVKIPKVLLGKRVLVA
jgi:hypothetical protein